MLKVAIIVVSILFVIVCALFNFRVSWANVNSHRYRDRRLIYLVVAEMATVAAAVIAYLTRGSWLVDTATTCESAGYNGGLAYFLLLWMGGTLVLMTGVAVYCAGTEGEDLWWHRVAKH